MSIWRTACRSGGLLSARPRPHNVAHLYLRSARDIATYDHRSESPYAVGNTLRHHALPPTADAPAATPDTAAQIRASPNDETAPCNASVGEAHLKDQEDPRARRGGSHTARGTDGHPGQRSRRSAKRRKFWTNATKIHARLQLHIDPALIPRTRVYGSHRIQVNVERKHTEVVDTIRLAKLLDTQRQDWNREQTGKARTRDEHESWQKALDILLRNCPDRDEIFDFQVRLSNTGSALNRSDTVSNLAAIGRRFQTSLRLVEARPDIDTAIISLSGPEVAVRDSIIHLVRTIDKLDFVRVNNDGWRRALSDAWDLPMPGARSFKVENSDSSLPEAPDEASITLLDSSRLHLGHTFDLESRRKRRLYAVDKPPSELPKPERWTKASFEDYIASLALARVNPSQHWKLFGDGPSFDVQVCAEMLSAFQEHSSDVISLAALKIAMARILPMGPGHQYAAREILTRAEIADLPLDSEVLALFQASAAKHRDMKHFIRVLRAMVRKGYRPLAPSWRAFFHMIEDPGVAQEAIRMMHAKRLDRFDSFRLEMTRALAILSLERAVLQPDSPFKGDQQGPAMREFLDKRLKRSSAGHTSWLDKYTMHRLLQILGRYKKHGSMRELLEYIYSHTGSLPMGTQEMEREDSYCIPDVVTMNIVATYPGQVVETLELLVTLQKRYGRTSRMAPDSVTYNVLYQMAWRRRMPNTMRVLWQYAVLTNQADSALRSRMRKILQPSETSRHQGVTYQTMRAWRVLIFDARDLAQCPAEPTLSQVAGALRRRLAGQRPWHSLFTALLGARNADRKIHREGTALREQVARAPLVASGSGSESGDGAEDDSVPVGLAEPENAASIQLRDDYLVQLRDNHTYDIPMKAGTISQRPYKPLDPARWQPDSSSSDASSGDSGSSETSGSDIDSKTGTGTGDARWEDASDWLEPDEGEPEK